jgi:uncharacterized protein YcnI
MMPRPRPAALPATLAAMLLAAAPVAAHVSLETQAAAANATYKAVLRVPHGCDGAATTRLVVTLPEGALNARPMPKPGWRLSTTRRALETPIPDGHGGTQRDTVATVTWEGGPLPDEHYDEFVLIFRTPDRPGETAHLPTVQHCEGGATAAWTEIPAPGRRVTEYRHPAPALRLLPARGSAAPREGAN